MHNEALYLQTLSEFERVLVTVSDIDTVLAELTARAALVFGLCGCSVSLGEEGRIRLATAHGRNVSELELLQERLQSGPCVTAYRSGHTVVLTDIALGAARWPEYVRLALTHAIRSVAAVPLCLTGRPVGVLDMYADQPVEWTGRSLAAAKVLADMATIYLGNASVHRKQVELSEQLQHALDSRLVIEQAKGMLAGVHGITTEAAFERLRSHARSHRTSIRSVARDVISLELRV